MSCFIPKKKIKTTVNKFYVLLTVHLDMIVEIKSNLMHNLFLVHFVNLYMFWAYLGPSSGGTTVCIQQLVLSSLGVIFLTCIFVNCICLACIVVILRVFVLSYVYLLYLICICCTMCVLLFLL